MNDPTLTRRSLLRSSAAAALTAAVPSALLPAEAAGRPKPTPVGLELYSVRDLLAKDLPGTLRAVAKAGYEVVEFYAPYQSWTVDQARDVRKLLGDLNLRCRSTHNGRGHLVGDSLKRSIELNKLIGSETVVMASPGRVATEDDWKAVAADLAAASETLRPLKMRAGYHNHDAEFRETSPGVFPLQTIAANTPKDVTLQFDVGTCLSTGHDPVAWVNANPGRIRSLHLKPWSKAAGYKVLFGDDDTPWAALLDAAVKTGGAEYFLIEQETSPLESSLEAAAQDLVNYRKLRGAAA